MKKKNNNSDSNTRVSPMMAGADTKIPRDEAIGESAACSMPCLGPDTEMLVDCRLPDLALPFFALPFFTPGGKTDCVSDGRAPLWGFDRRCRCWLGRRSAQGSSPTAGGVLSFSRGGDEWQQTGDGEETDDWRSSMPSYPKCLLVLGPGDVM